MDLREAEDVKKRRQEYTEELYKKDLHDLDNHDGVITHLEPDILECKVKWAWGSITTNKVSGGDGIPVELFQSEKMMLWKCCTQYASKFGKLSSSHNTAKGQFPFQPQRKEMPKKCSNYHTIALISHTSKVMLKILQARLQQFVNCELPDVHAGLRKGRGTRDQIANIHWNIEKSKGVPEKLLLHWLCQSFWLCGSQQTVENSSREFLKGIPDHLTCLLRNLYAGQEATIRTGHGTTDWFQIGKGIHQGCILSPCLFNLYAEYIMRNVRLDEHKLESRLPGEISIPSDTQMTPPF